jgi:hypothetical protein
MVRPTRFDVRKISLRAISLEASGCHGFHSPAPAPAPATLIPVL